MSALEHLIPSPRRHELDHVDLAAPAAEVWEIVRHAPIGHSTITEALFALRTLPDRLSGKHPEGGVLRIDDMRSSRDRPGFQILADEPPREVAVGAIGKVWKLAIPFTHVPDAEAFAAFAQPGWIKVAWVLRVVPRGPHESRLELELRVDATDEASWKKFQRYFGLIGRPSRFIRRSLLRSLQKQLGAPEKHEYARALPGDELLPDATAQITDAITIAASPEQIWPWLAQLGCRRGGFYSIDLLDNGGVPSAREIHPELQHLAVGDILPATPHGADGFEVLRVDPPRSLVLGGLYDLDAKHQLPFSSRRPTRYWDVTWSFTLEPLDHKVTRLHARARAAFPRGSRLHALWIRPVHAVMQAVQLRNLAARAEGRLRRDGWRDIVEGIRGAAHMALDFVTPRRPRSRWGLDERAAQQAYPGDELIARPRWGWTHAVEIDAAAEEVWPWVAQIGADRAGFYSYQWLENLAGCNLRNAETLHAAWQVSLGDGLLLHPKMPPLSVVALEPDRHFVTFSGPGPGEVKTGKPWVAASWLFLVEPLGEKRCRFVSRYRVDSSGDLRTRAAFSEFLLEPIGFEMDRRMLLGVKERVERQHHGAS